MADLGTLTAYTRLPRLKHGGYSNPGRTTSRAPRPVWRRPYNGVISGTLYEGATPAAGKAVYAYHKTYGELSASGVSDALGRYTLTGLDPAVLYTVMTVDDSGTYNAVVQDRVKPSIGLEGAAVASPGVAGALAP